MAEVLRPPEPENHYRGWFITVALGLYDFCRAILLAIDIVVNVFAGGRRGDTISARCGRSIFYGGWASRVRWPRWWVEHCFWAASLPLPPR